MNQFYLSQKPFIYLFNIVRLIGIFIYFCQHFASHYRTTVWNAENEEWLVWTFALRVLSFENWAKATTQRVKSCERARVCVCVHGPVGLGFLSLLIKPNFNELSLCITFISTFTQSIRTVYSSNSMKTIMWRLNWKKSGVFVCLCVVLYSFVYVHVFVCL